MIELLFFILKLIGWIVLGILGLLLGILLLVLFCALRYRLDGKKEEGFEGKLCVTWLFRMVSVVLGYQEGVIAQVRLLGKTVWKLNREESSEEENGTVSDGKTQGGDGKQPEAEGSTGERPETEGSAGKQPEAEGGIGKQPETEGSTGKQPEAEGGIGKQPEAEGGAEKKPGTGNGEPEDVLFYDEEKKKQETKEHQAVKKGFWERIQEKIAAWIEKLRFSFTKICDKLKTMNKKRQWFLEQWNQISAVVKDPANQASVRLIGRQIKKIFRHILPRKGRAEVTFGREDPYLMGKLLSYAGAAYPFVHKVLVIHPVFGEDFLEGEVHIRGRIRPGVILGCVLRLLFNKNIRQKLKEVRYGR